MNDEDDLLAAEHALGLSDATARVDGDAGFALAVDRWRARLLPMMGAPEKAPPTELWARIAESLPPPAPAARPARTDGPRIWRMATYALAALAASFLAVIVLRPVTPVPAPTAQTASAPPAATAPKAGAEEAAPIMVAALTPAARAGGTGLVAITFDGREGRMTVLPTGMDAGGKAAELWVIPADGKPRSLGVIPDKSAATMVIAPAERRMLGAGVRLAITLEPPGGAPGGRPSGPVVMAGEMRAV